MSEHYEQHPTSKLMRCTDTYPVEWIGGPHDGERRPANENGLTSGGVYAVESAQDDAGKWRILSRVFVPFPWLETSNG